MGAKIRYALGLLEPSVNAPDPNQQHLVGRCCGKRPDVLGLLQIIEVANTPNRWRVEGRRREFLRASMSMIMLILMCVALLLTLMFLLNANAIVEN